MDVCYLAQAMLAEGNQRLVIAQSSSETDQDRGRIVHHARQIIFQLAEVALPRGLFAAILERITRLYLSPG
ncbi:hypothetical protein ACFLXT_01415 [Chloroflexota bacterium]